VHTQEVDDVLDEHEDVEELFDEVRFLQVDDVDDDVLGVGEEVLDVADLVGGVTIFGLFTEDQARVLDGRIGEGGHFGMGKFVNIIGMGRNHGDLVEVHIEGVRERGEPFGGGEQDDVAIDQRLADMFGQREAIVGHSKAGDYLFENILIIVGQNAKSGEDVQKDGEILRKMEQRVLAISPCDFIEDHREVIALGEVDEVTSRGKEDNVVGVFSNFFVGQYGFDRESRIRSENDQSVATSNFFHVRPVFQVVIVGNVDVRESSSVDLQISPGAGLLLVDLDLEKIGEEGSDHERDDGGAAHPDEQVSVKVAGGDLVAHVLVHHIQAVFFVVKEIVGIVVDQEIMVTIEARL